MLDKNFEIGDLVWAQVKDYPYWPGTIKETKLEKPNKRSHFVEFFGIEKSYAWVSDEYINHHSKSLIPQIEKKTANFKAAIDEIINESEKSSKEDSHPSVDGNSSNNCLDNPIVKSKRKRHLSDESEISVIEIPLNENSHLSTDSDTSCIQPKFNNCINNLRSSKRKRRLSDGSEISVTEIPLNIDGQLSNIQQELSLNCDEKNSKINIRKCHLSDKSKKSYLKVVPNSEIPSMNHDNITTSEDAENASKSPKCNGRVNESQSLQEPVDPVNKTLLVDILKQCIKPTMKIGFIGAGGMGQHIVNNLLCSGHEVTVYNRTPEKCNDSVKAGAMRAETPADVVKASDIIFSCVSDARAVRSLLFSEEGVLKGLEESGAGDIYKGYIELTSIDSEFSQEVAECITRKGGKYIEASMIGTRQQAEKGSLVILVSGDETLYQNCSTCFHAISDHVLYISNKIGSSSRLRIVMSMFLGTSYAAIAETLALVERNNLNPREFLNILKVKGLNSDIITKGNAILDRDYSTITTALKYQQKELNLALHLSHTFSQPVRVTAASNELYKHAKMLGYAEHDVSSVYVGVKY